MYGSLRAALSRHHAPFFVVGAMGGGERFFWFCGAGLNEGS